MSGTLEDKDKIRELLAAYCFCSDGRDVEGLMALFTEDCVWDGGAFGRHVGKAAFRAFMAGAAEKSGPRIRHFTANPIVTVAGETAVARSYILLARGGEAPGLLSTAVCEDSLVRSGGRWLFAARVFHAD